MFHSVSLQQAAEFLCQGSRKGKLEIATEYCQSRFALLFQFVALLAVVSVVAVPEQRVFPRLRIEMCLLRL